MLGRCRAQVAVPLDGSVPLMYYRTDAFAAKNLSGPPRTWAEVLVAAQAINGTGALTEPLVQHGERQRRQQRSTSSCTSGNRCCYRGSLGGGHACWSVGASVLPGLQGFSASMLPVLSLFQSCQCGKAPGARSQREPRPLGGSRPRPFAGGSRVRHPVTLKERKKERSTPVARRV
jgi:hypothetical protein